MDNFIFSLNVTIPIFFAITLGYVLRRINVITDEFVDTANRFVFKIALPVMLFREIAESDILSEARGSFVIFCMLTTILMFVLVWVFSFLFIKDRPSAAAFAQVSARGSAAILGVAFVENICGSIGMAPLMIVAAVPFFNILSVMILTAGADIKKMLKGIITNPIIIGIILGIPFAVFKVKFPVIIDRSLSYISSLATPLALIAIGGGFEYKAALTKLRPAMIASFIKLIALPAAFLPIAMKMNFAPSEMAAVLIMLASPSTVSCYIMAKNMGADEVLTSDVIVLTTILSSVTLTMWIFILKSLGQI